MTRAWTLLRGIAALAALLAAVFGLPAALLAVGGSPIPHALPDVADFWDTLTSRDDGTVLFAALRVVAWAGWALFTLSVLADLLARARRVPVPRLGPQQALASQMIAAVVAISVLVPTTAPAAAAPPGPQTAAMAVTDTSAGPSWLGLGDRVAAAEGVTARAHAHQRTTADSRTWQGYRVRAGDTLWDLADDHLGDPFRWPEIYAASLTVEQPDGRRLHDPDLILPGWTLRIPVASAQKHAPTDELAPEDQNDDERQALEDAQTLKTPFTPEDATTAGPTAPGTPLSAGRGHAARTDSVVIEDWRGRLQEAVPELG